MLYPYLPSLSSLPSRAIMILRDYVIMVLPVLGFTQLAGRSGSGARAIT